MIGKAPTLAEDPGSPVLSWLPQLHIAPAEPAHSREELATAFAGVQPLFIHLIWYFIIGRQVFQIGVQILKRLLFIHFPKQALPAETLHFPEDYRTAR